MKVLIACGGSGGHIFPGIALAQGIKEKDPSADILFVGSDTALDRRIFEKGHCRYKVISSNKMPYKRSLKTLFFFLRLFFDMLRSMYIVARYRPDVTAGFGGYVSSPVVLSAIMLRIPVVIHEQNVVPGRANSILFRFADRVALSFEETKRYMGRFAAKAVVTGNPIRISSLKDDRRSDIRKLGLDEGKFTLLVVGGSQGAHRLNDAVIGALEKMSREKRGGLQIIHITGVADYERTQDAYRKMGLESRVFSFVDNIEEAYSASDLVVTRSGASAIFEIAYFGRPMILVPYPFAMSHQSENAKVFSGRGAAVQLDETLMSVDTMKDSIERLIDDRAALSEMGKRARSLSLPGSSHVLASEILSLSRGSKT